MLAHCAVPQDFPTLRKAIAAAPEGGLVVLGPGRWEQPLRVCRGVTVKGLAGACVAGLCEGRANQQGEVKGVALEGGVRVGPGATVRLADCAVRGEVLAFGEQWREHLK